MNLGIKRRNIHSCIPFYKTQTSSNMRTPTIIGLAYQLTLSLVFIPLHIYWLSKWNHHRNHFVIRHRFPVISITIFIIAIIVQITAIVFTCLGEHYERHSNNLPLKQITQALSFLEEGLVFYRVHLIYVRYVTNAAYLSKSGHLLTITKPKMHRYHACVVHTLLVIIITGTIWNVVTFYLNIKVQYAFGLLILLGIAIVMNLIRAKVTDSIGCVQESASTVLVVLAVVILLSFSGIFFENREEKRMFNNSIAHTSHVVIATVVLYLPIRLINKAQSKSKLSNGYDEDVSTRSPSSSVSDDAQRRTTDLPNEPVPMKHVVLDLFLTDSNNYKAFTEYLSRCFALESLLFCERVIILYHVILKYKDLDEDYQTIVDYMKSQHHGATKDEIAIPMTRLYALKFDYLAGVYEEMEATIQNAMDESGTQAMKYKQGILAIVGLIYKQFCCADSPMQINVCYEVAHALSALFENKEEKEIAAQFDSYEKLCWIFDDALHQTWMMCQDVYAFRFRMYLEMQRAE
eukprot:871069_1